MLNSSTKQLLFHPNNHPQNDLNEEILKITPQKGERLAIDVQSIPFPFTLKEWLNIYNTTHSTYLRKNPATNKFITATVKK